VAISEGNRPGWWWGVMRSRRSGHYGSGDGGSGGRPGEEDDRARPARQRGRRGEGWVGRPKATGLASWWASAGERGVGRGWVKNRK
jgi:hypothetical protein